MTEDTQMHTPPVYWGRINGWSVLASGLSMIAGAAIIVATSSFWFAGLMQKIDSAATKDDVKVITTEVSKIKDTVAALDERGKANNATAEANFRTINEQVNGIPYRTGQNENAIKEANARIDRIVDSIGGDLKAILQGLNKTDTKVEVLGSQLDDLKKTLIPSKAH